MTLRRALPPPNRNDTSCVFELPSKTLQALLLTQSPVADDDRDAITRIAFEVRRDRVVAIGTDARILVAVSLTKKSGGLLSGVFAVARSDLHALRARTKQDLVVKVTSGAVGTVRVKDKSGTLFGPYKAVQQWVSWQPLIPAQHSGEPAQFDPRLLADLGTIAELLGGPVGRLPIAYNGPYEAARVDSPEGAVGVIMPVRIETSLTAPSWIYT
jgi:hypothetical protein